MTIGRYSRLLATDDTRLLSRYRLVKPSAERLNGFTESVRLIFDEREALKALNEYYRSVYLYNRVHLLETLYYGLILTTEQKYVDYFVEQYGRKPLGSSDYKLVLSDMRRTSSHLKTLQNKNKGKNADEGGNFEQVIASVEVVLGYSVSRDLKLYQFKQIYDLAIKKINTNG